MPRNPSTGVYSKPAGTTPSVGQVIDPVPWNALTTDLGNEITNSLPRDGSAPMVAPLKAADGTVSAPGVGFASVPQTGIYLKGGTQLGFTQGGVDVSFERASVYAAKSANYTAIADDNNAVHRYTAAATVGLTAAVTLGANWHYTVIADGGDVTIDPSTSETINGQTTLIVPNGCSASIVCDGSNFFTVFKPNVWETIGDYSLSAVGQLAITGLSAFRKLRISGYVYFSAIANASIQTSSNNGSSYDSGATDYSFQSLGAIGASPASSAAQTSGMVIANSCDSGLNSGINLDTMIENFNQAVFCRYINRSIFVTGGSFSISNIGGSRAQATARNAFRLFCSAGTMSGSVTVEGVRS
ncbi:hypothetical protein [Rhizobium leguminosarum]|uniref:hypothetical protein n=1 Tax=Rhizobium leguminosarum TaxID=384 RepID=UPI001FE08C67|nr:hypothetical protein [Rhizobium leguminosarum]